MKSTVSLLGVVFILTGIPLMQEIPVSEPQEQETPQEPQTEQEEETAREEVITMTPGPILDVMKLKPPPGLLPLRKIAELQPGDYVQPPAVFHEGALVAVCRGGVAEGFDEDDGEFLWKLGLPDKEIMPPVPTTYGLFFSTRDGTLFEVETSTGEISEESSSPISLALPPLITDEAYVLASPEGEIVAVDPWTMQQQWKADTEEAPAALAVGGDLLVVSGAEGTLTAIEVVSGQLRWRHRGRGAFLAPAVFDAEAERLYVGDETGDFYSLSADKGKTHYRWQLGAAIVHPVLIEGDRLYVTYYGNTLIAYRTRNGHELWRVDIPGRPASRPVRIKERLVIATMDGFIVEVDPSRGRRVGAPYQAPDELRGNVSFCPPYAALPLVTGDILLLETEPPKLPPLKMEEPTEPEATEPPKKGPGE